MSHARGQVPNVARHLGLAPISAEWQGIDAVLPIIEKMRADGAVVLIKFDGERRDPADAGPFTLAVIGKVMGEAPLRRDAHSLEDALGDIILEYARRFWSYRVPS